MSSLKHKSVYFFVCLSAVALAFAACTLDKEPEAPAGANNEIAPVFLSTEIGAITHDSLRAKARLSSLGNLTILHHGWVWSEDSMPTLQDNYTLKGALVLDSFELPVSGLTLGKTYHLRPFVITGSDTIYDKNEKTMFMGIPKVDALDLLADSACMLRLRGSLQSPLPLSGYGIIYLRGAGAPTLQQNDGQALGAGINNGSFDLDLGMLSPNTAYSLRAYATTASGTGYSRVLSVSTPASLLKTANFTFNTDAEIFREAIVQFTNTSAGATGFSWSFGDGESSVESSPVHTFSTLGNMTVRLTATNEGCALTKDTLLKVVANPFEGYWVKVEGGTFMMGCTGEQAPCDSDENPAHEVTVNTFFMGKTEVTQGQWKAVTKSNPSHQYDCGPNCPVESVSWERVVDVFIPALKRKTGRTHRLPTEAEWEFAARGGIKSKGYKYPGGNNLDSVAWHWLNADHKIYPVGSKTPNELGLYDMSGSVWEWCKDWYSEFYYASSPQINPSGPANGEYRVVRGGSGFGYYGNDYRSADRIYFLPQFSFQESGFRIVRQ